MKTQRRSCPLIGQWRQARWHITPASALWIALSDPGAFIMERQMLLGIKARAERTPLPRRDWPTTVEPSG